MENAKTLNIQLALIFKNNFLDSFEKAFGMITNHLSEPVKKQYIPLPSLVYDIPGLNASYEKFDLQLARGRIDLFSDDFPSMEPSLEKIFSIIGDLGMSVNRVGFVKTFMFEGKNIEFVKPLLSDRLASLSLKEVSIRINKTMELSTYNFNNVENITEGSAFKVGSENIAGVLVTRDINSLQEDTGNIFDSSNLEIFTSLNKLAETSLMIQ